MKLIYKLIFLRGEFFEYTSRFIFHVLVVKADNNG